MDFIKNTAKKWADQAKQLKQNRLKSVKLPRFEEENPFEPVTVRPDYRMPLPETDYRNITLPRFTQNEASPVAPKAENKWKDVIDSLKTGFGEFGYKQKQFFTTTLPRITALAAPSPEFAGMGGDIGAIPQEEKPVINKQAKAEYERLRGKRESYLKSHPEWQKRPEWDFPITEIGKHPDAYRDPAYWVNTMAENAAPTILALGSFGLTTALTGNPLIGGMASAATTYPIETQDVYDSLVDAGASHEQATNIAPLAGTAIEALEQAGNLPLFGTISKPLQRMFHKELTEEVTSLTLKQLAKEGLKTFAKEEISEAVTEVAQEAVSNAAVKTFNRNKSVFENLPETFFTTLVSSLPFSVFGAASEFRTNYQTSPQAQQELGQAVGQLATEERGSLELPGKPEYEVKQEPGTPEAGMQSGMFGEQKEVRPQGKGEIVQIKMDDELKLSQYNAQQGYNEKTTELDKVNALIEAKQQSLNDNRAKEYVRLIKTSGKEHGEISNLTPKQYRDITHREGIPTGAKNEKGEIRWEYVLDQIADQAGYSDAESMKEGILQAKADMDALKELKAQQSALKSEVGELKAKLPAVETEAPPILGQAAVTPQSPTEAVAPETPVVPPTTPATENVTTQPEPERLKSGESIVALQSDVAAKISEATKSVKSPTAQKLLKAMIRTLDEANKIANKVDASESVSEKRISEVTDKLTHAREIVDKLRASRDNEAEVKNQLTDYIQYLVPPEAQGKLLDAVKNAHTEKEMGEVMDRADRLAEETTQKNLRRDIYKELSETKPTKTESGILKGKYTADVQEQLMAIRHNLKLSRDNASNQIARNIEAYQKGEITNDQLLRQNELLSLAGIKEQSSTELQSTLKKIQDLKETGRLARAAEREANDLRLTQIKADVLDVITGGKGLKPGAASMPKESLTIKKSVLERLVNAQYSWDNLLDKLSKLNKSQPYQSKLSEFGKIAHESTIGEVAGISQGSTEIETALKTIFGLKDKGDINQLLNRLENEKVKLGPFKNTDGDTVTFELTKDQIMKKVMEFSDPTLESSFRKGMKWTNQIAEAFANSLSEQELAWANWQMEFYQKYWERINSVYSEIYGVDLPHNLAYSPINRDVDVTEAEDILLFKELQRYASVTNSGVKSRVQNIHPLRFTGANLSLLNHVVQMEHFINWAKTVRDLKAVFGSTDVRAGVLQNHGQDILNQVDKYIVDFTRGGVDKSQMIKSVDFLRRNFTRSVLGLKPVIALNQIPTTAAYMTEMPIGDFFEGVTDFWSNPIGNYKKAMAMSPYLKDRYTQGFERDVRDAMNQNLHKRITGQKNVLDNTFALMNVGDKVAVIQGWWAKYKSELKAGKNPQRAMMEADMSTNRTQNTSSIETLSSIQRGGSWQKLFTMFQNQQNKYFRIIADNMRNLQYGRGNPLKHVFNIALAWAVLPAIFQLVADGFKFKKDRQLRAVGLGPLNNLLIFGQITQTLADWAMGEDFDYQGSPVFGIMRDLQNGISNTRQFFDKMKTDDLVQAMEYYAKAAGELTGLPTPYLVQAERGLREGNPLETVWSRYALDQPKKKSTPAPTSRFKASLIKPSSTPTFKTTKPQFKASLIK